MRKKINIREKKDNPLKKIGKIIELPQEFLEGATHIEIAGNREIIIEGCKGIIDYTEESIKLSAGKYAILIIGKNLEIKNLFDESIIINGFIIKIEYIF